MNSEKLIRTMGVQPFRPWPADSRLFPSDRRWHVGREPDEIGSWQRIEQTLYRYDDEPLRYLPEAKRTVFHGHHMSPK